MQQTIKLLLQLPPITYILPIHNKVSNEIDKNFIGHLGMKEDFPNFGKYFKPLPILLMSENVSKEHLQHFCKYSSLE